MEESIREGPTFPAPSSPIHCMQHSRFETQDGWKLQDISLSLSGDVAVSGYLENIKRTFIDIYGVDNANSGAKTPLYSKEFEEYQYYEWPQYRPWRYISFGGYHLNEIVTCVDDKLQVIDFEQDRILRFRKVIGRTVSLSVCKKQIFVGFYNSNIVSIYDKDLNRIKSVVLKDTDGEWPRDMVAAEMLYVCTWDGKAISVKQHEGSTETEYTAGQYYVQTRGRRRRYMNKANSISVSQQLGLAAVLWNQKQISCFYLANNTSFPVLYDESGVSRIRLSNQGRIVTGNNKGEVKTYDLGHFFTFNHLKETLASMLERADCEKLMNFLAISEDDSKIILGSEKPIKALLLYLENEGFIQPFNVDKIEEAFTVRQMDPLLSQVVNVYKMTRSNLSPMTDVLMYKEQYVDEQGGVLLIPEANISLHIPPEAISQGTVLSITIPNDINRFLSGSEVLSRTTPLVICEPDGLIFARPVELIIPHCAVIETAENHKVTVKFGEKKTHFTKEMTWTSDSVEYQLTKHFCRLLLTHFSGVDAHIGELKEKILRVIPYAESGKHTDDFVLTVWLCNDIETDYQSVMQSEDENGFIPLDSYDTFNLRLGKDLQCTTVAVTLKPLGQSGWIPEKTEERIDLHKLSTATKSKCAFRLCKDAHNDSEYFYVALKISQNVSNGEERETLFILRKKVCDLRISACSKKPYMLSGNETCILSPSGKPPTDVPKTCTAALYMDPVMNFNDDMILTLWLSSYDSATPMFKSLHREQEFHSRHRVDTENSIAIYDDKNDIVTKTRFRNGNWSLIPDQTANLALLEGLQCTVHPFVNKRLPGCNFENLDALPVCCLHSPDSVPIRLDCVYLKQIKTERIRSGNRAKFQFIGQSRNDHQFSFIDLEVETFQKDRDKITFMKKVQLNSLLYADRAEVSEVQQVSPTDKDHGHLRKGIESNKSKAIVDGFKRLCQTLEAELSRENCELLGKFFCLKPAQLRDIYSAEKPSSVMFCQLQESCICTTEKVGRLQNGLQEIGRNDLAAKVAVFKTEVSDAALLPRFGQLLINISKKLSLESSIQIATIFEVPELWRNNIEQSETPGLKVLHVLVQCGLLSKTYTMSLRRALIEIKHHSAVTLIDQYNSL